jgi:3-hydroxyisobutyrate dehydrogenase-like beta-hydroxyacid dehydrogenase
MPERETIGLIGAGLLGSAIAERLLQAGWSVLAWDVDAERRRQAEEAGAQAASSAGQIAACRRIVLSLPNSDIASQVIDEITPSLAAGVMLIDTTTGAPEASERNGRFLAEAGMDYFDATVLGSSAEARQGAAVAMVGGRSEAFGPCEEILRAFTRQAFFVGPWGSGARMKLVVNLALGLHRAVLAEALCLAERSGLDPQQALRVLQSGAAYSRVMDAKGEKMLASDFTPQARLAQHWKDVRLILDLGRQSGAPLPLSEVHERLLAESAELGCGDLDNSAIIQWHRARS